MPDTKKVYYKSLAQRDAQMDPSVPMPAEIPEGGIMEEGVASGVSALLEQGGELRMDRASFLKLSGFSFAAATLAGCGKAAEKALPYLVQPEQSIPGVPLYYASVCGGCSAGCGILAKDRDGRPIKLEGNPQHPLNHGAMCGMGQASVLGVYDTHRLKGPRIEGKDSDWASVDQAVLAGLKSLRGGQGKGKVRLVSRTVISPSLKSEIASFLAAHPGSKHVVYDPLSASAILDAHQQTHGRRVLPHYRFDQAEVIAAFDADFLGTWISPVEFAGAYQSGRRLRGREGRFSKHFHVESGLTVTGSKADERATLRPSEMTLALAHLAVKLGAPSAWTGGAANPLDPSGRLDAMASALKAAGPKGLVVCGSQDLNAQLIVNDINHRLGAYGSTLDLKRSSLQRQGDDAAVASLIDEMGKGEVAALIVLDGDPVAELAQGQAFADGMKKTALTVSMALGDDDTAALCLYRAPDSHWLESWSDAEPLTGMVGLIQPAVRPLYKTRQAVESLALWQGKKPEPALDMVKAYWKGHIHPSAGKGGAFDAFWDDSLRAGFVDTASKGEGGAGSFREPKVQPAKASASGMEVAFYPKISLQDGRHAVNPWIQELPDPINKISWDQTVAVNAETGKSLGLAEGDMVKVGVPGSDSLFELPVHLQPGQDPRTFSVPLGYGRVGTDRFHDVGPKWLLQAPVVELGQRLGVNVAPLMTMDGGSALPYRVGATLSATGENVMLACTQIHQSINVPSYMTPQDGARVPIVQELSLEEFRKGAEADRHEPEAGSLYAEKEFTGHRWAMAVDLTACNGCSACVIACQVENNVPVVGREEVRRAHEMHWIRIDRYYHDGADGLETISQPMMCQQCGHAPCEPVCPVAATTTSEEGINMQVYNRCVGTRYCANNCPYKVRRFNWFDYPSVQGSETLALNPDVTVRSRGVMEKCNFCVQRVQEQRADAKRVGGKAYEDGDIKTACQQTCPARAISFGDINDPKSEVSRLAGDVRAFKVLEDLNTKPAVSYLAQVRNKS